MDSGAYLGAAVLPLSLAARVRRGPNREIIVEARNSVAALVAKFRGRLFVLGDIDAVPGLSEAERADFLAILNRAFDGKVEAIGWGHDGPAIRAMLKANALPHQEAFLIGAGMGHQVLGEAAGLPLTKDIDSWHVSSECPGPHPDVLCPAGEAVSRDRPQNPLTVALPLRRGHESCSASSR